MNSNIKSQFYRTFLEYGIKGVVSRIVYHVRCRFVSIYRKKEWKHLPPQEDLLLNVLQDAFVLIILDACRYDYFKKNYQKYINGKFKAVRSPASNTPGWLKIIFRKYAERLENIKIFSANPHLHSKSRKITEFTARDYVKGEIIDLWDSGWDSELGTVEPNTVFMAVEKEGLNEKNLIWFMQPHFPWIGETRVQIPDNVLMLRRRGINLNQLFNRETKLGNISKCVVRRAYEDNLLLVLQIVKKLLNNLQFAGKVVVTSDHGELLGEHGVFMHPPYLSLPEQRIVPWLEICD
ncbi:MAG: hypothetical protein ACFFDN_34480 [Candidatus Hodarchaeota archaeon]